MNEIVPLQDKRLAEYEKLLVQRDTLKKEAELINQRYYVKFGGLIIKVYEMQVECIKLKKMIAFVQQAVNRNEALDLDKLSAYIGEVMAEYRERIKAMYKMHKECSKAGTVSEMELMKIKRIYRDIVKKLHPDVSPLIEDDERLRDLWEAAYAAYTANDLTALEEAYARIQLIIAGMGGAGTVEIQGIEDKIQALKEETDHITSTPPYTLKPFVTDPLRENEKRMELENELDEYTAYREQLQGVLRQLTFGTGIDMEVSL